jgi:hypothetical protein
MACAPLPFWRATPDYSTGFRYVQGEWMDFDGFSKVEEKSANLHQPLHLRE